MGIIRVLNEATINQIAAGEVVENPSSVVKELVENSLDAGAHQIWIEIRGGGFQLIRVADNGKGMNRDDAVLCFERHATSKISRIEDLNTLCSMGFRGEALASIASVAKVDLITCQEGKDGVEVEIEAGVVRSVRAASRSPGTTVSVRSLFYNVPARKKFQKSAASTTADIHKLLFTLALAHPEVGFELAVGDTLLLSVPPEEDAVFLSNLHERIEKVFDASFMQGRRAVSGEQEKYLLQGWLGSASDDRINRAGQYLFINRRALVSPLVASAIKVGYGHRLDARRYPVFVIHLTIPPSEIDVNVHPQKREVRFQKEERLQEFLIAATRATFHEMPASSKTFHEMPFSSFAAPALRLREEEVKNTTWIQEPHVIGLFRHYLLLDDEHGGIWWVNLQKAQEYTLIRSLQESPAQARAQGLLIPLPLSLDQTQQRALHEKQVVVNDMGFSIERSGKDSFLIHAIPCFIEAGDAVEALKLGLEEDAIKKVATFAVRGKKRFMLQEALALWHKVKECGDPEFVAKIGPHDIEKFFR